MYLLNRVEPSSKKKFVLRSDNIRFATNTKGEYTTQKFSMKRLSLLVALVLFSGSQIIAQEGPVISSAIIAIDSNNDIPDAKQYIDEAAKIISTKDLASIKFKNLSKFYYYTGIINFRIYQSQDEAIKALDAEALDKAAKGFMDLLAFEEARGKKKFTRQATEQMPYIANAYGNRGIQKDAAGDPMGAFNDFQTVYNMRMKQGVLDTSMLYNSSVMAQKAGMLDKAIEINNKLIEIQYKGVEYKATDVKTGKQVVFASKKQRDLNVKSPSYSDPVNEGDLRADIYLSTANLYKRNGDTATYDKFIEEGRVKYPENEAMIRAQLQKYLETQQYDKAMVNLDLAIQKDPSSKLLLYIKGNILQTSLKDIEGAVKAYDAALAVDPNYVDPLYMKGLIHIDAANAISEEMNALPLNAKSKYDALKKKQKSEFEAALPFFEKANGIAPDDLDTLRALKEVYYKLRMIDKAQKVDSKLAELEG